MGRVIGAFATSHILMGSPDGDEAAKRVVAGMREIGRRVRACEPDVIFVIGVDHMFNVNLKLQPVFAIGVAETYVPLGDMDIPRKPIPGHAEAGEMLSRFAYKCGFDPAKMAEYYPDHGVALPMLFAQPDPASIPIVPILVNINLEPPPTAKRCQAFGEMLGNFIQYSTPDSFRAVVIGTGGLSHWINLDRHGEVDEVQDRAVIDLMLNDDWEAIVQMEADEIVKKLGNGGLEIVNWLAAAVTAEPRKPELIYYEPMPHWLTGMGGMAFADHGNKDTK